MNALKHIVILVLLTTTGFSQNLDYRLKDTKNSWVNIEDLQGESLTIVDFWASWCKPCLNGMPYVDSLYLAFKDRGVGVIGVNVDAPRNQSKVGPLVLTMGISYPIVFDPDQELMSDMNASVLPTLIVLNSKGKVVYMHEGFAKGDEVVLREKIEVFLNDR